MNTRSAGTISKQHPSSPVSARELLMYVNNKTLTECKPLYEALDATVKAILARSGTDAPDGIAQEDPRPVIRRCRFPSFLQKDKRSHSIRYKGKYVLLEFWASWCGPCRAENPNLRKQMEIFGSKGFNVLGVSLDKARDPWIKAIEKDGLTWTQVFGSQRME